MLPFHLRIDISSPILSHLHGNKLSVWELRMVSPALQSLRWFQKLLPVSSLQTIPLKLWTQTELTGNYQRDAWNEGHFCCLLSALPLLFYFDHYYFQHPVSLGQRFWLTSCRNLTHPVLRALFHHWLYLLQVKVLQRERDQLETVETALLSQPGCRAPHTNADTGALIWGPSFS